MLIALWLAGLLSCSAEAPSSAETAIVKELKKTTIGGKEWTNPTADTPDTVREGAEAFRRHCAVCHGLDGHNTGVPFAERMSPPVADLGEGEVQKYSDGQLKWIIQNGLRFTGMPGWSGILRDDEVWAIVRYIRHLPEAGSVGAPAVYQEEADQRANAAKTSTKSQPPR